VIEKLLKKIQIASPRGRMDACDEIIPLLEKISDTMERGYICPESLPQDGPERRAYSLQNGKHISKKRFFSY